MSDRSTRKRARKAAQRVLQKLEPRKYPLQRTPRLDVYHRQPTKGSNREPSE